MGMSDAKGFRGSFHAARHERISIIAGLIDSDGSYKNHSYTVMQSGDRGRAMTDQLARLADECGIATEAIRHEASSSTAACNF